MTLRWGLIVERILSMHKYKTLAEIKTAFNNGEPFSVARFKEHLSYLCYQVKCQNKELVVYYNRSPFFKVSQSSNDTIYPEMTLNICRNKMADFSKLIKEKGGVTLTNRKERLVDCTLLEGYANLKELRKALDQDRLETGNAVICINNGLATLNILDLDNNSVPVHSFGSKPILELLKEALDLLGIYWKDLNSENK